MDLGLRPMHAWCWNVPIDYVRVLSCVDYFGALIVCACCQECMVACGVL